MIGPQHISTKLLQPQRASAFVDRSRLLGLLNSRLSSRRLTIIAAPAGYGKTTLASHWLSTLSVQTAWLSLDERDNDLETFAGYIMAAVNLAEVDACRNLAVLLAAPQKPSAAALADAFIEDLALLPDSLVLTLDDYHVIDDASVHEFMTRVVRYVPSNCQLVITTRQTPPWPLGRLRASGELLEVGMEDLRFTTAEARKLLMSLFAEQVEDATVDLLEQQTEGWAVGLQLAALSLRGRGDLSEIEHTSWDNRAFVTEYLLDEVLAKQPAEIREVLLRSSILDRFCDPLLRAILGPLAANLDDGGLDGLSIITRLHRANLFLVPLDSTETWFRYHHLFSELLRRRLADTVPAAELQLMHSRASSWFAAQGLPEEAIRHALAADDGEAAEYIINAHLHDALNREQWRPVSHWLDLLPPHIQERPAMLVARGWILNLYSRFLAQGSLMQEAEIRLAQTGAMYTPAERELLRSQIDTLRAVSAYWVGQPDVTLTLTQRALPYLGPDMLFARSIAQLYFGLSIHAVGRTADGLASVQEALDATGEGSETAVSRLLLARGAIFVNTGDFTRLHQTGESLGKLAARANLPVSVGWSRLMLGIVAYEWNDLVLAEQYLSEVVQAPYEINGRTATDSFILLAMVLQAQGQQARADDIVMRLRDFLLETGFTAGLTLTEAVQLRLAAMRGDTQVSPGAPPQLTLATARQDLRMSFVISPLLARVHFLIASGQPAELKEARAILGVARVAAESTYDTWRLAEALALQASLEATVGDEEAALDALTHSLALGEPGRLIRTYADCGPTMRALLERLREHDDTPYAAYAERLLGAFAGADAISARGTAVAPADNALLHLQASLTNREREVLLLLSARQSNKEIAGKLVITSETVKKYTRSIYRKLGVNNRRAAVGMAEYIGLIPPSS